MILVIGATGQSGAAVLSALVARNIPVRVLIRPHRGAALAAPAGCELAPGDITRPDTLAAALGGVTGIVNCVGVGHDLRTRPATIEAVEVSGNRTLIEAAVQFHREHRQRLRQQWRREPGRRLPASDIPHLGT